MAILILGLFGFISVHMIRVVNEGWRTSFINRFGEKRYKAVYSLISILSFAMMVWGYAITRDSALFWHAPVMAYIMAAIMMLLSMLLLAGFHIRKSHLSVMLRHPMLWSVILLCAAHLLVNGRVNDILLFGSILVWSCLNLISCYGRDKTYSITYPKPTISATLINITLGLAFFGIFTFFLH